MIDSIHIQTVAIIGPGLLGGSLARAIKAFTPSLNVHLWGRREAPLQVAQKMQAADLYTTDLNEAIKGSDLVVLATPVGVMTSLLEKVDLDLLREALVTDVGSVKESVHRHVGAFLSRNNVAFIGSHPMAGSEKQGMEYTDPNLFRGATVVLTNEEECSSALLQQLTLFWESVGSHVVSMGATTHDQTVARISHVPHVLASLCAQVAGADGQPLLERSELASTGFRDTTRVSMGNPEMWAEILLENSSASLLALDDASRLLDEVKKSLESGDKETLVAWLKKGRNVRKEILQGRL
jgi:prephenate dehydrogenase